MSSSSLPKFSEHRGPRGNGKLYVRDYAGSIEPAFDHRQVAQRLLDRSGRKRGGGSQSQRRSGGGLPDHDRLHARCHHSSGAFSAFWGSLAYTLIGGTAVGTVLTLLFLPALYSIWFRVKPTEGRHGRPKVQAP